MACVTLTRLRSNGANETTHKQGKTADKLQGKFCKNTLSKHCVNGLQSNMRTLESSETTLQDSVTTLQSTVVLQHKKV